MRGQDLAMPAYEEELGRLWESPTLVAAETGLMGATIRLMDGPSFVSQYREIVVAEIYDFPYAGESPVIIDGGANIGIAVLWWMARWPKAKVIAFEPDPFVFEALQHNSRYLASPELHRAALSTTALGSRFLAKGSDAGRLGDDEESSDLALTVPTVNLGDVLDGLDRVDLLKLDIEGAETEVLMDAESHLGCVDRIFVEYHSFAGRRQTLAELLELLRRSGFRIHLATPGSAMRPFCSPPLDRGIDLQCNIWAWRESYDTSPDLELAVEAVSDPRP